MTRPRFDIGLVVPLAEEFRAVVEVAPVVDSVQYDGTFFYRLDLGTGSAICCVPGRMGILPALQAASKLLQFADVKILAVVGVGGALDLEVRLGDVVVADEVNEFQANSKAQPRGENYEVRYSGRHWPLTYTIREAVRNFEFSAQGAYAAWRATATEHQSILPKSNMDGVSFLEPSLHVGPVASGNIVAASGAFVEEVKRINRKFIAIDMEAAGVVATASDRVQPLPWLVVRGISDHANEQKAELDRDGRGAWRRYAVRNAASLLCQLVGWSGFRMSCGLDESGLLDEGSVMARLVWDLRGTLAGPWLVGVSFGSYLHAPIRTIDGGVTSTDVSRLLVADPEAHRLLEVAKDAKAEFCRQHDFTKAMSQFKQLAGAYRELMASSAADALLTELDNVVTTIACPAEMDAGVDAILIESENLERSGGVEAALGFLAEVGGNRPRVRSRRIDLLAQSNRWSAVLDAVMGVPVGELSRSELEHAIFAYAQSNRQTEAVTGMRHHRDHYDDRAARLFYQGLVSRFSWIGGAE